MWQAQSVQLVWFLTTHEGVNTQDLYRKAFKTDPDTVQSNRVITPAMPFLSLVAGVLDGRTITFQVQPGRLDVIIQAEQTNFLDTDGPPVFDLRNELERLRDPVQEICNGLNSVIRISTVATLTTPAETPDEGVKNCAAHIGLHIPTNGVTDFIFQVNRRAILDGDVEINRLLRWNVFEFHSLAINANIISQAPIPPMIHLRSALMLDFNTPPQNQPYSQEKQLKAMTAIHQELLRFSELDHPLKEFEA